MAPDSKILKQWYTALVAENSFQVGTLLKDKRLLNKLWNADAQARVQLSLQHTTEGAKGRTALHVAARRGNVELVKQILTIAGDGTHDATSKAQGGCSSSAELNNLLSIRDEDYGLDALAMAVINGNKDIVNLLKEASKQCESNPYDISRDAGDEFAPHQVDGPEKEPAEDKPALHLGHGENKAPVLEKTLCQSVDGDSAVANQNIARIRSILDTIWGSYSETKVGQLYSDDYDFNFLKKEYLFHFTFSTWPSTKENEGLIVPLRQKIFDSLAKEPACQAEGGPGQTSSSTTLWRYLLLKVWDGQGRTPLHVAVDSKKVGKFLDMIPLGSGEDRYDESYLNVVDSVGRTPLYRAAAKRNYFAVKLLMNDRRTTVSANVKYPADKWGADLDLDKLSWRNGFKSGCVYISEKKLRSKGLNNIIASLAWVSSTALHAAIIHRHENIVKTLLNPDVASKSPFQSHVPCTRRFTWPVETDEENDYGERSVDAMQLSVLVGNIPILQHLLAAEEKQKKKTKVIPAYGGGIDSFLLAAAMGNPDTIKAFLDKAQYPLVTDGSENSALHHALKGHYVKFHPHLVDFVGCGQVQFCRRGNKEVVSQWLADPLETSQARNDMKKRGNTESQAGEDAEKKENCESQPVGKDVQMKEESEIEKRYGHRRGCIKLLMESGIDIAKQNSQFRTARPQPDAPEEFVTWWYEKVAEETQRVQEKLNAAANAISVTAALVATASYVGPFQPPLGYGDGDPSVRVNILAVRIFLFCNNLSFYFALAAITYSLIPAIPVQRESVSKELLKTRILVGIALGFLLPSIICVLTAFATSYIAVTPDHGLAYHGLTLSTIVIGGLFCLNATIAFAARVANVLLTLPTDVTKETTFAREFFLNPREVLSVFTNVRGIRRSFF